MRGGSSSRKSRAQRTSNIRISSPTGLTSRGARSAGLGRGGTRGAVRSRGGRRVREAIRFDGRYPSIAWRLGRIVTRATLPPESSSTPQPSGHCESTSAMVVAATGSDGERAARAVVAGEGAAPGRARCPREDGRVVVLTTGSPGPPCAVRQVRPGSDRASRGLRARSGHARALSSEQAFPRSSVALLRRRPCRCLR